MTAEFQNKLNKRDSSEFLRWQERERIRDEMKAAIHIAERKAGAKCARYYFLESSAYIEFACFELHTTGRLYKFTMSLHVLNETAD